MENSETPNKKEVLNFSIEPNEDKKAVLTVNWDILLTILKYKLMRKKLSFEISRNTRENKFVLNLVVQ
jgi:hypothetical protein